MPTRQLAFEIYQQYKDSNIVLSKEHNITQVREDIFDNDFSLHPEKRDDLWWEETANQAFLSIFKVYKEWEKPLGETSNSEKMKKGDENKQNPKSQRLESINPIRLLKFLKLKNRRGKSILGLGAQKSAKKRNNLILALFR